MFNNLNLGWNNFFQNQIDNNPEYSFFTPARVIVENKHRYIVLTENGEFEAEISGKLFFSIDDETKFPKVGDWVMIYPYDNNKALIHNILNRKTTFSRKAAGHKINEQVIAANIDYLFIVQSCNSNFNIRRLERYLLMANAGKITPVVILSKIDLTDDVNFYKDKILEQFPNLKVILTSAVTNKGIDELKTFIQQNNTYAFVGSSGTGKSTLINTLVGYNLLETNDIRLKDDKGKHTTTRREIILMPNGGILIDTPGMREFHLWKTDSAFEDVFSEIEDLSDKCKFSDCKHINEKGCAILDALRKGIITQERYNSFIKLKKEEEYLDLKDEKDFILQKKDKAKKLSKLIKEDYKYRNKYKK